MALSPEIPVHRGSAICPGDDVTYVHSLYGHVRMELASFTYGAAAYLATEAVPLEYPQAVRLTFVIRPSGTYHNLSFAGS